MTEKRCALIIASYEYEDTDLRQLVAPAQDAEALAHVLADPAIGGFEVQTLLNELSYQVNRAIETFFADRRRDDLILLYFSGHGIKDEEGRLYLTTRDTRRKMLRTTAIPATLVNDVMRYSRSRRQVLLLDCCYSGAFARGLVVRAGQVVGTGEYFKEARGQVVLTASDALQYSFEGDQIKGEGVRSVFTHTLVRGLETGEADLDGDGYISFDELYDYVYDRVTDEVPQQKPRKWVFDVQGEILIARNPHPVMRPAKLPPELLQAMGSPFAGVREGAVHELDSLLRGSHKGLALAAQSALTKLADDDSRLVSTAAAKSLAAFAEAQRAVEVERQVEQLPTEKAERIAEKPKVEPLAPEPVKPRVHKKPAEQAWNWERLRWPFTVVGLLALVIGLVVIKPGGDGKPTPTPTTSAPVVPALPRTEPPTVTVTPTTRPKPAATPNPPTAIVTPRPPTPTPAALQPAPSASLHATWNRPTDGMVLFYVPGGIFQMGSAEGDAEEQPVHSVTLDSFWIDQTEVTNAQYARCVATGVCSSPSPLSSVTRDSYYGDSQYDDYPVIYVTWDQARTYCQWVGGRLPTEAEWEYAARGPDGHLYPWGNDRTNDRLANYAGNVGDTTRVGSYPDGQSWVGAMDMAGNVWEWVNDWYGGYPSEAQVNPTGPASGPGRVLRGGSWLNNGEGVRAAGRPNSRPDLRYDSLGFRCVVEPGS
jgi:formylglycine-generating enzyme required for sulfatase activity